MLLLPEMQCPRTNLVGKWSRQLRLASWGSWQEPQEANPRARLISYKFCRIHRPKSGRRPLQHIEAENSRRLASGMNIPHAGHFHTKHLWSGKPPNGGERSLVFALPFWTWLSWTHSLWLQHHSSILPRETEWIILPFYYGNRTWIKINMEWLFWQQELFTSTWGLCLDLISRRLPK